MPDDPGPDSRRVIFEKLEHGLALSNLINHDSLGNLLERFGEYLRVGLVAIDPQGTAIGKAREIVRPCRLDPSSSPCGACASELPAFEGEDKFVAAVCASGVRYLRARIDNMFEPVGYLVIGPLRTVAFEPPGGDERAALRKVLEAIPVMSPEQAHESALLLATVLEEVVFANYQSYLFSKMHLQLSRENLSQVADPDESRPDEGGYLDSGQFSSLF